MPTDQKVKNAAMYKVCRVLYSMLEITQFPVAYIVFFFNLAPLTICCVLPLNSSFLQKWWSKLSRRFRNLNVNRTFKIQSSKIQVMHSSKSMDNLYLNLGNSKSPFTDSSPVTTDSAVTWRSLASGKLEIKVLQFTL